ncbi:MAG: type II toxin-antitoxin system YafQ family toxin [Verrucomicrobiota bacterium]
MSEIFQTSRFKKDVKKIKSRGKDIEKLLSVVKIILAGEPMEERHHDHPLSGKWTGSRDCHIEPDWVLIYRMESDCLYLERTGSHP